MAKTKIEYGERTWNPLAGCTIVSEGCVNCWAKTMAKRLRAMGRPEYQDVVNDIGNWTGRITLIPSRLDEPYSWRDPQHVLVEYMGDLFHEKVEEDYIQQIFNVMRVNDKHTYQVLTKRPERMLRVLRDRPPQPHVYLGVSIENNKRAIERRVWMKYLHDHGWNTWVSYGPALGPVEWEGWEFIQQLVCEGESGPRARPMHPNWARSARDFCQWRGIKFFFKQWGEWVPISHLSWVTDQTTFKHQSLVWDGYRMVRVGKAMAGRMLDGQEWSEMPQADSVTDSRTNGRGKYE